MTFLIGDIGGTKTRLAVAHKNGFIREESFHSKDFSSLEEIISLFLQERVEKACLAIAGPIREGVCKTTNLAWIVDEKKLSKELQIADVKLLNDLEATAWGALFLEEGEFAILNKGKQTKGNLAVIAAGTGLGEAIVYWDGKNYHPFACEGGHTDFASQNGQEKDLFDFLQKKYGHVSYERVVSGMGLKNLYSFLAKEEGDKIFDLPKKITEEGLKNRDSLCGKILDWFCFLYGREAGNLALKSMALGGVFIGGGIAPKILEALQNGRFIEGFCDKGRFKSILSDISVKVILNENAALIGALHFLKSLLS